MPAPIGFQPRQEYFSGFSDLLQSGNTGLQSQLDWSRSAYPMLWPSGGNRLGGPRYEEFRTELQGLPEFSGKTLEPLVFQGDEFQTGQYSRGRSGGSQGPTATYHPYGMIPMGASPEQASIGLPRPYDYTQGVPSNLRTQRYFDPTTSGMFDVARRGNLGYVYNRIPGTGGVAATEPTATPTTPAGETPPAEPTATPTATEPGAEPGTPAVEPAPTATPTATQPAPTATPTGMQPAAPGQAPWQQLFGQWGGGPGGITYQPGFNLPQPEYPVEGDRPSYSDYTNQQIINSLRASNRWAVPGDTEGTFREREGWTTKSDQDVLDHMAGQPGSWLQAQQKQFRPAALAQMGQDIGQRNEFQQRTQAADILNMANQGFLGSMGMLEGYGQSALREVQKNYMRNVGRGRAGLAGRGMTGTTVFDAMRRGAGEQAMDDWLQVQDAITGQKIQTYQQGIGGIVNALNSIQYRTMHPMEYANLYPAFGEGGAGADVPEAPSTTTNALLGTALGVATPLLLNSIFGPVGAIAGGAIGSVAAAGGDLLGGVGNLLEGAWDFVEDIMPWNW